MYDAIVIGGGLSGLISAREIGKEMTVLLLEARELGGRSFSIFKEEYFAEQFEMSHFLVQKELERYNIPTRKDFVQHDLWSFPKSHITNQGEYPCPEELLPELTVVFQIIDLDSSRLYKLSGLNVSELPSFDITWCDYVDSRLDCVFAQSNCNRHLHDGIKSFLKVQCFSLVNANPLYCSALCILHKVHVDGGARNVFLPKNRFRFSITTLMSRIQAEIESNPNITVITNTPVNGIYAFPFDNKTQSFSSAMFLSNPNDYILISTSTNKLFRGKVIVCTLPLTCINSLQCVPPLPKTLLRVGELGNCSRLYRMCFLAENAPTLPSHMKYRRQVCFPNSIVESMILGEQSGGYSDGNSSIIETSGEAAMSVSSMLSESALLLPGNKNVVCNEFSLNVVYKSTQQRFQRALDPYGLESAEVVINDHSSVGNTSFGTMDHLPNGKYTKNSAADRVSSPLRVQRHMRGVLQQNLIAESGFLPPIPGKLQISQELRGFSQVSGTLDGPCTRSIIYALFDSPLSDFKALSVQEELYISLRKHYPSIKIIGFGCYDFMRDSYVRCYQMCIKAGMYFDYVEACKEATSPWHYVDVAVKNTRGEVKSTTATLSRTGFIHTDYRIGPRLIFASGDLSLNYPGTFEGSLEVAFQAVRSVKGFVQAMPDFGNFIKIKPPAI